jgi:hypothetical protein
LLNILVNIGRSIEILHHRLPLEKHTAMKSLWSFVLILLFSFAAAAQKEVPLQEVSQHVGDSVTVAGKVFSGRFFAQSEGAPTLLNIGAAYPHQLLTVVIRGTARKEFAGVPERDLLDKDIKVSGKVELYKGKPQLVVHHADQLTLAGPAKTGTGQ